MGKKEYEGLTLYDFNQAQDVDMMQFKFSLHKAVLHVPSCMIVDHPLDWSLMERALNIEIERNDCLRLHFVKTKEGLKQYYIPQYTVSNVPVDDYRGMKEEEAKALLHKRGSHPVLKFTKGEVFRVRFFRAFDGRYGVYLCASHLNMDLAGEFLFYKDLFSVYYALEKGEELPKPLEKSEDLLKHDLEKQANVQKREKDEKFFREFFNEDRMLTFYGIDGPRLLEQARKKKKDPSLKSVSLPTIIFDKTETETAMIDADLVSRMYAFMEEKNVSLAVLFCLAYQIYFSAINNRMQNVLLPFVVNRRTTLSEINSGGARASCIHLITKIAEDRSFKDSLSEVSKTMMQFFSHVEFPYLEADNILHANMNFGLAALASSMIISCMPPVPVAEEQKNWNFDFSGFSNGHGAALDYTIVMPNTNTGEIAVYYEYNTHFVPQDAILKMHEGVKKIIEKGIADPDMPLGQIMDTL